VQIAMDQGFRTGQELELQPGDRDMQVEVVAEGGGGGACCASATAWIPTT